MAKKKKNQTTVSMLEVMKSVRSPFSTCKMTGAGPHKSKRDFNRQAQKLADKKLFDSYK